MATNRLSYVFRTQFRLNCFRNRWHQLRKETVNWNGCKKCLLKMALPYTTANAAYAFSIPGFSWGTPKEEEKKQEEVVAVIDKTQRILIEADRLYSENEALVLYEYLVQFKDMENDEVLWRLARAAVDKGKLSSDAEKKTLYYEAYDYITDALALNQTNFAVHKWYAILLDYIGVIEGNKQRITNSFRVKEHFLKAVELNPKDATSIHSLGQWCYSFADMPWYQRRIASVIFETPPSSTYEEALTYFLQAEETEPNFYSMNLLMLGQTYMKLRDSESAYKYLKRCQAYPVKTPDDRKAQDEAIRLLKVMGVYNKPGAENLTK